MRWMCVPCGEELEFADLDEASEHLAGHGCEVDRWPDGSPVVIDQTLEPREFAEQDGDGRG